MMTIHPIVSANEWLRAWAENQNASMKFIYDQGCENARLNHWPEPPAPNYIDVDEYELRWVQDAYPAELENTKRRQRSMANARKLIEQDHTLVHKLVKHYNIAHPSLLDARNKLHFTQQLAEWADATETVAE